MHGRAIRQLSLGAVVSAALAVTASAPAAANEYKLLVSWAAGSVPTVEAYLATAKAFLEEHAKGEITFRRFGPEVVPPFEQLQPVSSGSFDMLYTHPAYHGGATGIGMMLDTVKNDPAKRRSTGVYDWIDNYYQKAHHVKVVAMPSGSHFQFLLREPIGPSGDLEGRKIRSNPAYDAIIEEFGGSPVTLPVPQIFPALQKGLVDGTAFPIHSMVSRKFFQVAKYMARPAFGHSSNLWLVNLDTWNKMSAKDQNLLLQAGRAIEDSAAVLSLKIQLEDEQAMIQHGGTYTFLNLKKAAKIEQLYNEGIWGRGIKVSGDKAKELIALLKEKDMVRR